MSIYTLTILVVWLVVCAKLAIKHIKTRRKIESYKPFKNEYTVIANNKDELYLDIEYQVNSIRYFQRVGDLQYKDKEVEMNYKRAVSKLKKNKLPRLYQSNMDGTFIFSNPKDWTYFFDYLKIILVTLFSLIGLAIG